MRRKHRLFRKTERLICRKFVPEDKYSDIELPADEPLRFAEKPYGDYLPAVSVILAVVGAVLAVWFIQKKHWLWGLPAGVCMILSLSIYQSYIAVAASLLVLVLIQQLLKQRGNLQ